MGTPTPYILFPLVIEFLSSHTFSPSCKALGWVLSFLLLFQGWRGLLRFVGFLPGSHSQAEFLHMLSVIFQKPTLGAVGSMHRDLPHGGCVCVCVCVCVCLCVCERERLMEHWGFLWASLGIKVQPPDGVYNVLGSVSFSCKSPCCCSPSLLPAPGKATHPSILHGMKEMWGFGSVNSWGSQVLTRTLSFYPVGEIRVQEALSAPSCAGKLLFCIFRVSNFRLFCSDSTWNFSTGLLDFHKAFSFVGGCLNGWSLEGRW